MLFSSKMHPSFLAVLGLAIVALAPGQSGAASNANGNLFGTTAADGGTVFTYRWIQTGCTEGPEPGPGVPYYPPGEPVCGATIDGTWTFDQEAVERGFATFGTFNTDGVVSFSFTIGQFTDHTIVFGPLTWTNFNAVGGLVWMDQPASYQVTFTTDREHISGISESSIFGSYSFTDFELNPMNPGAFINVSPNRIHFVHNNGSEPQVDGLPVTPNATLTGQWTLVPALAGTPGKANCHGKSVSALAQKYGELNNAAAALGFGSVRALQDAILAFCEG